MSRKKPSSSHPQAKQAPLTLAQARSLTRKRPDDAVAWQTLGRLLAREAQYAEAGEALERAIELAPQEPSHHDWLGYIAYKRHDTRQALSHLDRAEELAPASVRALVTRAKIYSDHAAYQRALEYAQRAEQLAPQDVRVLDTLGTVYNGLYRYEEALAIYDRLTQLDPGNYVHWNNAGNVRRDLALLEDAYRCYERAETCAKDSSVAYSNRLTAMHYDPAATRADIAELAQAWEARYAPDVVASRPQPTTRQPGKRLRLGMFSDGFRKHPVGKMIVRCLENLDPAQFELFAYTSSEVTDDLTRRIKATTHHWRSMRHLTDAAFAQQVRDDGIDILIDLSGHNSGNRMRAVAMQPAPLLVKWVGGLINTTGVAAMDYLISDAIESPEGEDAYYTEKLIRMPEDYIVFDPPAKLPEVGELPATRNGYITLACFNNPTKLNSATLAQWAAIMHQLPDSRLLLKGRPYTSETFCERLYAMLEAEGIKRERLMIEGPGTNYELLEAYNRVDIALDPWPYSGGLTTCEAFLMGVPVVTMPGPTFAGRHSATHLAHAGMPELVTHSWEEYHARVLELASDLDSLATIRSHLREVLVQSPVCDGPCFARHFTTAMRAIWQRYCADELPAALSIDKEGGAYFEGATLPVQLVEPQPLIDENDERQGGFNWELEGKLIAIDNGGQLLHNKAVQQLLKSRAMEVVIFDPAGDAINDPVKNQEGIHYYSGALLGDGQPTTLYACLDPKQSATLKPLQEPWLPEDVAKGNRVLTELPVNTIPLNKIEGLPSIDWLVLDASHDNSAILEHGAEALENTLLIQVKVAFQPTHEGQAKLGELENWANNHGFRLHNIYEIQCRSQVLNSISVSSDKHNDIFMADFIFLPDYVILEKMDYKEKAKLSFLLHTIFKFYDLSFFLIDSVDKYLGGKYFRYFLNSTPELSEGFENKLSFLKAEISESQAEKLNALITSFVNCDERIINEWTKASELVLYEEERNNAAFFVLSHSLCSSVDVDSDYELGYRLRKFGWEKKERLYNHWFDYAVNNYEHECCNASVIVISNGFKEKLFHNLKEIRRQGGDLVQIIFVNNGRDDGDFESINDYVDTWVRLKSNSGAYLARNVGFLFSRAPLSIFIDDDGYPDAGFIDSHLIAHSVNKVICARGVCKSDTIEQPKHYYLGSEMISSPPTLEGNVSVNSSAFAKVGGWGDYILFGHGGFDLSVRFMNMGYDAGSQIYIPDAVLFHDYVRSKDHAKVKTSLQKGSWLILDKMHGGISAKIRNGFFSGESASEKINSVAEKELELPEHSFSAECEKYLLRCYENASVILEYGTGASTLLASRMLGKHIYGVENDFNWAERMKVIFNHPSFCCSSSPHIYHVDIGKTGAWAKPLDKKLWESFPDYPMRIWDEPWFEDPDVVLIDGRLRTACFLTILLKARKKTTVLFDDYRDRTYYHVVEKLLKPVDFIDRMAVFEIFPDNVEIKKSDWSWIIPEFYKVTLSGRDGR
ncbi:glycosyltransferase [Franzmannia qiaohouensis]|uniref:protein O-GlcNAc transferase n=1 Tax=Franzmannia qiaohouensis TaxID=1329370 RepID=A0ABU1HJ79_9GAMM|nr:glycosyltransferase [Halomonas qiaohouensis]MDR5907346.1 glycosyltransferase [Halomonas qiaohouensis]